MVRPWNVQALVWRSDEADLQTCQEGRHARTFLDEPLVEGLSQDPRLLVPI